jgi:hypothetical protein
MRGSAMNQPRRRRKRQRPEIDMSLIVAVVSGNVAGQHARVGGVRFPCNHADADTRQWTHGERAQHLHVGVATANQQQVSDWRNRPWRSQRMLQNNDVLIVNVVIVVAIVIAFKVVEIGAHLARLLTRLDGAPDLQ